MSYHSAKGLTFDSVFMPGLVTSAFSRTSPDQLQKLLFVARSSESASSSSGPVHHTPSGYGENLDFL